MIVDPIKGVIRLNQTEVKKVNNTIKILNELGRYIPKCKALVNSLDGWKSSKEIAISEEGANDDFN